MELRVLGPVEVRARGRLLAVGRPQQAVVLAALVVDAGRPVPVETLVDRVWEQAPPPGARRTLHTHVSRIRRLLGQASEDARLARGPGGYVLEVDPGRVDLHRFRGLVGRAREANRADAERVDLLRAALSLWRGEPLAGLPGEWALRMRKSWRQQWLEAIIDWSRAERQAGASHLVIDRLTGLVEEYPLVEPLAAELMLALHAGGRSAEALGCYAAARQRLVEQLGVDPGPELRALHQAMLRGEPYRPATTPPAGEVPAQLPLDIHGFIGRERELARLDAVLAEAAAEPTAVVVSAVSGTAGVGKTALAVHWAHRVAGRFHDGQLYVNLRAFDPGGAPMGPAEAVRGFLEALGVPPQRVPASLDAMAALYRSLLAGRRVLVVLDNARDFEQVRPLLPGSPGSLVVVTSRNQVPGLFTSAGAHAITLELLTSAEARQLLARRLGTHRVDAEPLAVAEIADACARLPLALAIAAARAAASPRFSLDLLAGELRGARGGGLEAFSGGDVAADLRAVLSWSYRTLSAGAARLFRLLGIHPGPDIATAAAGSLAGVPQSRVRPLLAELIRAHLLAEHLPGRYRFHDLLREYAAELARETDAAADLRAALHRVLDHYLHTALSATVLVGPNRRPITPAPPRTGVSPEKPGDLDGALAWLSAERPVLLAAIRRAADTGFGSHAWQLAWAVADFLDRRVHWHEWAAIQTVVLEAVLKLDDRNAWFRAHGGLAVALAQLGRHQEAEAHFERALELCVELGDHADQALTHFNLGQAHARQGRHAEALDHSRQALELYTTVGSPAERAAALNNIGWCHAQLGDHRQALDHCRRALTVQQELGDRTAEAATWDSLGYAHHRLGDYRQAIDCYEHARDLCRRLGERYNETTVLDRLGDSHHAAGDAEAARDAWRDALATLDVLGHPDAEPLRAKLGRAV